MKSKRGIRTDENPGQAPETVPFPGGPGLRRQVEERERGEDPGGECGRGQKPMTPEPNWPGAQMVMVEACHGVERNCPNVLINPEEWKQAVDEWIRARDVSERIRQFVSGPRIHYHHKLKVVIAGCPNGCSRPRTADLAIVGAVSPEFDPAECESCGNCAGVCPDFAIEWDGGLPWFNLELCQGCPRCRRACPRQCIGLSAPWARIFAGGRLGRHPRLAEQYGEAASPKEAVAMLDAIINDYVDHARPGERFADFRQRSGIRAGKPEAREQGPGRRKER